jgi:glutamate formiminotransferase
VLECVPNVSEGRRDDVLDALGASCGPVLLDLHRDPDHHRSVFTLAGRSDAATLDAVRALAGTVAELVDLREHAGVHPRLGALDVVPFVALGDDPSAAVGAAREFAVWLARTLTVPVFLYGQADPEGRSLPDVRRDAFRRRMPDFGPPHPHERLGATAVGSREVLVALNCRLAHADLALARAIAHAVRARDGGLPGVRALGLELASRGAVQVSMNLTDLGATGVEAACDAVRDTARAAGSDVDELELVGLVPRAELARWSPGFRAWSGLGDGDTIEGRLAAAPARDA